MTDDRLRKLIELIIEKTCSNCCDVCSGEPIYEDDGIVEGFSDPCPFYEFVKDESSFKDILNGRSAEDEEEWDDDEEDQDNFWKYGGR